MSPQLWAVTGVSGYIGAVLTRRLIDSGQTVRGLSRRDLIAGSVRRVTGDISDIAAVRSLVEGADVVVHLAAYVHRSTQSARERELCRITNVEGTRTVIDACSSVPSRPFLVFVSTAAVYGDSGSDVDENAPTAPPTEYAKTKWEAELLIREAIDKNRIRGVILRPAVVFGAGSKGNLALLTRCVRSGFFPSINGGKFKKALVPVGMLVAAIEAVVRHSERTNGQVYNVGGEWMTIRSIAELIAETAGVRLRVIPFPLAPVRFSAGIFDRTLALLHASAPSTSRLVKVYTSSLTLSDASLRALATFRWPHSVEWALRQGLRGYDLF